MTGPFYLGVAVTDAIDDNTKASIVWFSTSHMMLDEVNSVVSGGQQRPGHQRFGLDVRAREQHQHSCQEPGRRKAHHSL